MNRRGFLAALGKAAAAAGALGLAAKVASPAAAPASKPAPPPVDPVKPEPNPADALIERAYKREDIDLESWDEWKKYCAEPIAEPIEIDTAAGTASGNATPHCWLNVTGGTVWNDTLTGELKMQGTDGNWHQVTVEY